MLQGAELLETTSLGKIMLTGSIGTTLAGTSPVRTVLLGMILPGTLFWEAACQAKLWWELDRQKIKKSALYGFPSHKIRM
jgi:hypothetical protein